MKTQKGFAFLESLLILIIVGLLAGVGWYVWDAHNKTDDTFNNADQANSSVAKYSKADVSQTLIKIPELGVQFKVTSNLKDLIYKVINVDFSDPGNNNLGTYPTAYLSTKTLNEAEEGKCSIDNPSTSEGTVPPLGFLTKTPGRYPTDANTDNATGPLIKQFNDFYISLRSPGQPCFTDNKYNLEAGSLFNQLNKELPKTIAQIE